MNINIKKIKIKITRDKHDELQGVVAKQPVTRCSLTTRALSFL